MTMYRIISKQHGEHEPTTYTLTKEAAIAKMAETAQYNKNIGCKYWEYTAYSVEALEFDPEGTANERNWKTVIECKDLTDIFPAPLKNSDGIYEDEDDYWDDEEDE